MKSAADSPRVLGLDLSLTSTGWARSRSEYGTLETKLRGMERIHWLWREVGDLVDDPCRHRPQLVVTEGYSHASKHQAAFSGELGGVIRFWLHTRGIPYVDVAPTSLKMFATGSGKGKKNLILVDAVKRLGYEGASDDESDALWLREVGLYLLGDESLGLPKTHTRALVKIRGGTPFERLAAS